jgi:hypothetical protein
MKVSNRQAILRVTKSCTDIDDPNCVVRSDGDDLIWTVDFSDYIDDEVRYFSFTLEDGNGGSVENFFHTLNGDILGFPNGSTHCISVQNSSFQPATDCTFNFFQITLDPLPTRAPGCDSEGDYYFFGLDAIRYDVLVTCGDEDAVGSVTVFTEGTGHTGFLLPRNIPDGELCIGINGMGIDLDTPSADMGEWLGYGEGGNCVQATSAQLAAMSVTEITGYSGPACSGTGCPLTVNGLVVTGYPSDYSAGESRTFIITVSDETQAVEVYIRVVNGYIQ